MASARLAVLKTYKLLIGGKFPRTESGRTLTAVSAKNQHLAHYCRASRKDVRDAVVAARAAFAGWSGATACLRAQILYRAAEMLESRTAAFADEIARSTGARQPAARREVAEAADRFVYFAGWADKYGQVFGSVNPVASSHFNFTTPEPTGVAAVIAPDEPSLLGVVDAMAPVILSGNTIVVLSSEKFPLPALTLAEVLATSDFPPGVINVLSGLRRELAPTLASHMDINAIVDASADGSIRRLFEEGVASNVKRVSFPTVAEDGAYRILDTVEMKTAWHPIGW
ncbi:MAG: aldehyde dehydrogenase family protein [Verrucomicrobiales bacterium]